jgi:uncharacterized repeat protein (TIGR03803 family)
MKKIALFTLIGLCLLVLPVRAQINLLHKFAGGTADGQMPHGSLLISSSTLYGMTFYGGDSDLGVVFSLPVPFTSVDFIGTWDGARGFTTGTRRRAPL